MTGKLLYSGPSLSDLHERYAKQSRIDESAQTTCSASIEVDASAARVWQIMADLASWPEWAPGVRIRELREVRADAPFRWRSNGITISSAFAVVAPERELTWTGRFLWYRAVDRHLIEPLPGGRTRVTSSESLAGPMLPLLLRPAQLRAGHERWLAALKRRAESVTQAVTPG